MQQAQQQQVQPSDDHAGCWLESSLDLQAGLRVEEDLDMSLFELFAFAASLPAAAKTLH